MTRFFCVSCQLKLGLFIFCFSLSCTRISCSSQQIRKLINHTFIFVFQGNAELRQQLLALTEESENTESELADAVATKERLRKERVELERKTRVAREAVDETKERLAAAEEGACVCVCVYMRGEGMDASCVLESNPDIMFEPKHVYPVPAVYVLLLMAL
jgi:hypothetical protein